MVVRQLPFASVSRSPIHFGELHRLCPKRNAARLRETLVPIKKPLGRLAAKTYRVTGPWKEPKVEIISREQSRAATVRSPPSG